MKKLIYTKSVMRLDKPERKFRIARIIFGDLKESSRDRKGRMTYHGTKAIKLSLWAKLFHWETRCMQWALTILGIRIHYDYSTGGRHV